MNLLKAIVFLKKVLKRDHKAADIPLIQNTFFGKVFQFEELGLKDIDELVKFANSAHEDEVFGLKLYAKLLELKKCEKIHGDNICDEFYYACVE